MDFHPVLRDPDAVAVFQTPLPANVQWQDYRLAALHALQLMRVELSGERVVIKPNVTAGERFADPDTGIGTHPGFVEGMLEHLKAHGARRGSPLTIAEDPRDTDDNDPRHWRGTGYDRLATETGVRLHCPTTYTCVKKTVPDAQVFPTLNVSRLAVAPNTVLFNVPKLKTHNLGITTLCLKNLMGLVNVFDRHYCIQAWDELDLGEDFEAPSRPRAEWFTPQMHERWQEGLARRLNDTAKVIRPALNVIEGIIGREGTGFMRGRNRPLGLVIAGVNPVAVDAVASHIMGFDPQQVIYLRLAAEAGLGKNRIDDLKVYLGQNDDLSLCSDPQVLRVFPPFTVITNTLGEVIPDYQAVDSPGYRHSLW